MGTFLRRCISGSLIASRFEPQGIDWAVPKNIAPEIEHQAILFAGVKSETSPHSLIEKSW
jgi:hypothetical protein